MHGIARYVLNLLQAMVELNTPHTLYVIGQDPSLFSFIGKGKTQVHFLRSRVPPYSIQEQLLVPWLVAQVHPDVYHCLTYACPVLIPSRLLFTLHDLQPLLRPKEFTTLVKVYYKTFIRIASARASRIIVDSQYSAFWCSQLLGTPPEKISVVPLGGDHLPHVHSNVHVEKEFQRLSLQDNPYFLCVANSRPHKRVLYLVKVFLSDSNLRDYNVHLVLVGEQHPEVYTWVAHYDHASRIHCTGHVPDALLVMLYQRAVGLVCPSVGEGFGLPVLEAMCLGVPVLASQEGALLELLDGVGIFLPQDEEEPWRRAMCEILLNAQKRKRLAMLAAKKAFNYSWHKTALATLSTYEEIVSASQS
jgi:glycosyltransferase involved in cell wall biosynthesis